MGLYDPSTDQWTEGKDDLSAVGSAKYCGGVLLPDGRVVLVPGGANHVGLYDPSTDQWTEGKDDLSAVSYSGGVLLPDGRVVLVPGGAMHVGLYDPTRDQWTEGKDDLSVLGYWAGWYCSVGPLSSADHASSTSPTIAPAGSRHYCLPLYRRGLRGAALRDEHQGGCPQAADPLHNGCLYSNSRT